MFRIVILQTTQVFDVNVNHGHQALWSTNVLFAIGAT